jgi:hypothetical protein
MMMPRTRSHEILVTFLFTFAGFFERLRRSMEIRGANITPVYSERGDTQGGKTGHYLIQPEIGNCGRLDDMLGLGYSVITFDGPPQEVLSAPELEKLQRSAVTFLWIRPEGDTAAAYQAFDQWLGDCRRHALIVRPDRFVKEDRILPRRQN